ncbi:hypothetical protein ESY86_10615 [Subsaximicrobium wynnwilliamsii]|uniref:RiboL-PSP-HEPN domain-containing protein n=1 Tax=Subsaximicrobium wynnwilliamsii TaxID=291179 RepID=A0A5C6ZJV8_9FLAO|nr:hypothetical protein [Subsaximicrobium wynnwilliamsii]TXD84103.1 hypothetical protein ESY87_06225 [Subsaximicrobium wynnwilliamsii]TXD88939.1 hypothetical protein ESY86_10615 [Subsaximicrobium wynnwilliamsii]TXE03815.1 hypothetical protein ESY88_06220 [Subsaximicrobium wynnwilliamsii]
MESKFNLDSFLKLSDAANFYLEESFKYVNEIFTKDLEKLVLVEQLKDVQFSEEDLKLIEEGGIPKGSITYLRSDKRLVQFLTVETLNEILNAHNEVNEIVSNKKPKIPKKHVIKSIQILGHISNLALFVEVLTNRHLLFLNHNDIIDNFVYNQLSEGKILNIIIFICRDELENGSIKLDSIKHLFRHRNKAVHHTPKNADELKVKVEDLFQIWNQIIKLIAIYEDREKFNENKFSTKLKVEKGIIQDSYIFF